MQPSTCCHILFHAHRRVAKLMMQDLHDPTDPCMVAPTSLHNLSSCSIVQMSRFFFCIQIKLFHERSFHYMTGHAHFLKL